MNYFRWYEYTLSSSLMIVLIAMLFGVYDVGSLLLIFVLNARMNLFGLDMEKINQPWQKRKSKLETFYLWVNRRNHSLDCYYSLCFWK